jgi:lysyl-tRNA synthetase class I
VLFFINDTYDALTERQLRVAVNKDPRLVARFREFCGRPVAEVPDVFGCHPSYADHFASAWLERLRSVDIHPELIDTYTAYRRGDYAPYVASVFARYTEVRDALARQFDDYAPHQLFRVQCPSCSCIDSTEIGAVEADRVTFRCSRCGRAESRPFDSLQGKLAWKLDCAARWNLYGIDAEAFEKSHLAPLGTVAIASHVSKILFGGHVPEVLRYGHVRMSRACSGHLIDMLPPAAIKALFLANPTHDVDITPDYVEHFARTFPIRPGLTYAEWVRKELPRRALAGPALLDDRESPSHSQSERELLPYAHRYSRFFYKKDYRLQDPCLDALEGVSGATLGAAHATIEMALELRGHEVAHDGEELRGRIRSRLDAQPRDPDLYPLLKKLLGQSDGPHIANLLALAPRARLVLACVALREANGSSRGSGDVSSDEQREAA